MKKLLKILAAIAVVLAVSVAGLTFFVKSYLTDERIRGLITEAAEKSLNRKVALGSISVNIWSGIEVSDLDVKEKDSAASFAGAKKFVLKYQLLPLLSKKLVIDELRLEEPMVRIAKHADGSFNFSDMITAKKAGQRPGEPTSAPGLPVSMSVKAIKVEKGRFEYQDESGGPVKKLDLLADAELGLVSKSADVLASDGKVSVLVSDLVMKDKGKTFRDIRASAAYRIEADWKAKNVILRDIEAEAYKIPVKITGDLSYADPFSFAVRIAVPEVNLSSLKDLLTRFAPEGMGLAGAFSLDLTSTKKSEKNAKPFFQGRLLLRDVSVNHKGMHPVLNGAVNFTPDRISLEDFLVKTGENSARIMGSVANYTTFPDIRVDMKSSMLNLDALVPAPQSSAAQAGQQPQGARQKSEEKEFDPMKLTMKATGTIDIEKAVFRGVTLQSLKAAFDLQDNVFRLTSFSGSTLNGTFSGRSIVDLGRRGMSYAASANINGIKLEDLISAFAPKQKDTLYGALFAKADISGAGTVKATLKRNLQGKGNFSIKDGVYKNSKVSDSLLAFLGLPDLREIRMQKADGTFTITNGIVNLVSLVESKDLIIDEKGLIGLPDESLDIGLIVKTSDRLTPKMLRQPSVSQFLSEEKGWSAIPLRLGGTFANPSYSVDTRAIGKKAGEKVQKKLEDALMKSLSGDGKKKDQKQQEPDRQSPQQEQQKPQKKKKNVLDELFK
ncbi:MAG: hypothetical protein OHK006_23240 [Thermodesulfovibrionales bacterium]